MKELIDKSMELEKPKLDKEVQDDELTSKIRDPVRKKRKGRPKSTRLKAKRKRKISKVSTQDFTSNSTVEVASSPPEVLTPATTTVITPSTTNVLTPSPTTELTPSTTSELTPSIPAVLTSTSTVRGKRAQRGTSTRGRAPRGSSTRGRGQRGSSTRGRAPLGASTRRIHEAHLQEPVHHESHPLAATSSAIYIAHPNMYLTSQPDAPYNPTPYMAHAASPHIYVASPSTPTYQGIQYTPSQLVNTHGSFLEQLMEMKTPSKQH